ncbi:hypothetical protein NHQ30_001051 [Ciborinia camelliae]|nr:hypothetical protein NHQ30_001051 [Ciborinia camelliae]
MSLYDCDGCTEPIRPDKARIQCHICTDYNLCANCFVIQNVTRTHLTSHPTIVYKTSGTITSAVPPPLPPRPVSFLPPRKDTLTNTSAQPKNFELPTANWGALWDIVKPRPKPAKAPPPPPPPLNSSQKVSAGGEPELISISPPQIEESFNNNNNNPNPNTNSDSPLTKLRPDLPPRPGKIELEAFTNPYASMAPPVPAEWTPLFQTDGTQNAIFVDLMTTIFLCLDVENSNALSPEVWSAFLDMQGVGMEDNIWQKTLFEGGIQNPEIADLELGIYFKNHEIQHTLAIRQNAHLGGGSHGSGSGNNGNHGNSPSSAGERIRRSISLGANMPMLSKLGFVDAMGMQILRDPEDGCRRLREVMSAYGVWMGLDPKSKSHSEDSTANIPIPIPLSIPIPVPESFVSLSAIEKELEEVEIDVDADLLDDYYNDDGDDGDGDGDGDAVHDVMVEGEERGNRNRGVRGEEEESGKKEKREEREEREEMKKGSGEGSGEGKENRGKEEEK